MTQPPSLGHVYGVCCAQQRAQLSTRVLSAGHLARSHTVSWQCSFSGSHDCQRNAASQRSPRAHCQSDAEGDCQAPGGGGDAGRADAVGTRRRWAAPGSVQSCCLRKEGCAGGLAGMHGFSWALRHDLGLISRSQEIAARRMVSKCKSARRPALRTKTSVVSLPTGSAWGHLPLHARSSCPLAPVRWRGSPMVGEARPLLPSTHVVTEEAPRCLTPPGAGGSSPDRLPLNGAPAQSHSSRVHSTTHGAWLPNKDRVSECMKGWMHYGVRRNREGDQEKNLCS